ncbi:EpsG family protein [Ammoniphilus resinae]|uniref:EpsG family protein n=1 Tax=Ammoniphilus resinae TaxID=861532 RepID=A0ABS4GXI3_9BACL|nr:EpsG family protein [Ammoniphilus resinae]MBP1934983.1 hypothetical protein [Ammoniphilus resinae]
MFYYFFIAVWVGIGQLLSKTFFRTKIYSYLLLIIMLVIVLLVSILRPFTGDMFRYISSLKVLSNLSLIEAINYSSFEFGFVLYQWIFSEISVNELAFISMTTLFIFGLLFLALKKVVKISDLPLLFFGFLSFFYFYNFTTNILRQGIAIPITLLVIVYLYNKKYKKSILFLCLAVSFHMTAIILGILLIVRRYNLKINFLLLIFVISSVLMITGLNKTLMLDLSFLVGGGVEEKVTGYTANSVIEDYGSVNRLDFFIFTSIWMLWGLTFKYIYLRNDLLYEWLLKCYISLSSIYVLFGFIGYSDRIAAYAWLLIPILLFYPIVTIKSKYQKIWLVFSMGISILLFVYFNVIDLYKPLKIFY